jgi:lipid-A-disaccharide synthase
MSLADRLRVPIPPRPAYRVLLSAGDPSGDLHGARLARELLSRRDDLYLFGLGGPRMADAGVVVTHDNQGCSAIGVFESLKVVPRLWRIMGCLRDWLGALPPDLLVLIDYGAFNMRLAQAAKEQEVPSLYYIPPGCWSREMRPVTQRVASLATRIATPFVWSAELLREAGATATFVGHPLLDGLPFAPMREAARQALSLSEGERGLALLPGGRDAEVRYILPLMLRAAGIVRGAEASVVPLVSCAPGVARGRVERMIAALCPGARIAERTADLLAGADAGLVKSGTITLEAALAGLPMVVTYAAAAISKLQWVLLARKRVRFISLPNILADEGFVPELYDKSGTPARLAEECLSLLRDPERRRTMAEGYATMRRRMGEPGAAERVADLVEEMLH